MSQIHFDKLLCSDLYISDQSNKFELVSFYVDELYKLYSFDFDGINLTLFEHSFEEENNGCLAGSGKFEIS